MNRFSWEKFFSLSPMDGAKVLITAVIIVAVTKVQLFNDRLSALLIALPLTSLIAMCWMHFEKQDNARIANHSEGTFWFVLPTLPMFLILPWMLRFWAALLMNCVITVACFWLMVFILRKFGFDLMPK